MEKKTFLLAVVGISTFLIAFSVTMAVTARTDLSPDTETSGLCKVLEYSGPEAFNILVIGSRSDAEESRDDMVAESPYKERKDKFNFYYIDELKADQFCKPYKGIAVLCYSAELLKRASACPHNAILVPVDREESIRSSMYKGVLSLNRNHPSREVLRHELGHLFGLAEEYVPATLPKDQQNCVESCTLFEIETDGCFEGCSKSAFFRSIDEGVMRTLQTSEYGLYDESLITQRLQQLERPVGTVTGQAINEQDSCDKSMYTLLEIDASAVPWKIVSQELVSGCAFGQIGFEYTATLKDQTGATSLSYSLQGNSIFTDAPGADGEIDGETYEESHFWIDLPNSREGDTLHITDQSNEYLAEKISQGREALCRTS